MSKIVTRTTLVISSSLVLLPLLLATTVGATPLTLAQSATTTPTPTATATPVPTPTPSVEATQERVKNRIAALKIRLTAAEQRHLASKCIGAQSITKVLDTKMTRVIENRTKAYGAIDRNLTNLANRLTKQNVDVTTLLEQQAELKTKVTKLKTSADAYKQALADISTMDCAKDPTGFKASVEDARVMRVALVKEAADVRAYITNTLGGTLQQISSQLGGRSTRAKEVQ